MMPISVSQPGYETPVMPTRPLFRATFFTSHSMVS